MWDNYKQCVFFGGGLDREIRHVDVSRQTYYHALPPDLLAVREGIVAPSLSLEDNTETYRRRSFKVDGIVYYIYVHGDVRESEILKYYME